MKHALLAATAVLLLGTAANAATVMNGGFEVDPGVDGLKNGNDFSAMAGATGTSSWDIWQSDQAGISSDFGWQTNASPSAPFEGVEIQTAGTLTQIDPKSGNYYAELDSDQNSTIWQDIILDVGQYVLTFFYSPREEDIATNGITTSLSGGLLAPLTTNGPGGVDGTAVGTWTEITRFFEVKTAGTYTLTFDASGSSESLGGLIDDISVSVVPLPASALLLLGGLGGLAAMRKRRKS